MLLMDLARFMSYPEFMVLVVPFVVLLAYLMVSKEGLKWNEASGKMEPYKTTGFMTVLRQTKEIDWILSFFIVLTLGSGSWVYMKTLPLTEGDLARFRDQGQQCELSELSKKNQRTRQPLDGFDYDAAKDRCEAKEKNRNDRAIGERQRRMLDRMN